MGTNRFLISHIVINTFQALFKKRRKIIYHALNDNKNRKTASRMTENEAKLKTNSGPTQR